MELNKIIRRSGITSSAIYSKFIADLTDALKDVTGITKEEVKTLIQSILDLLEAGETDNPSVFSLTGERKERKDDDENKDEDDDNKDDDKGSKSDDDDDSEDDDSRWEDK